MPSKTTAKLETCPRTPNCVSSFDTDRGHYITPFKYEGPRKEAQYRLLRVLHSFKWIRVVEFDENYIHAEFISPIMRFVDDAEFYFAEDDNIIHLKSASRIGFSDLGVNRRRLEKIRRHFCEREKDGQ